MEKNEEMFGEKKKENYHFSEKNFKWIPGEITRVLRRPPESLRTIMENICCGAAAVEKKSANFGDDKKSY